MWDLSCPDWEARIRAGAPLIPDLPLIEDQARDGLAFFDATKLPDQTDTPRLGDAAGEWFRAIVRVAFGSWDPVQKIRFIRDIFLLAPKGSSKTSYFAALIIALLLMNRRRNAEGLFVGPTQSISDRAYEQTAGMIELDPALKKRFRTVDHQKTIVDRITHTEAKVKTFDLKILTGGILIFALIDELHLLGKIVHTPKVLRQIRGGLDKTPEGLLLIASTQSDAEPAGAFKTELQHARKIRNGAFRGMSIRPMLPILYEFPDAIMRNPEQWQDPANWPMVMPNLGRSIHLRDLVPDWETERGKGDDAIRIWASQHLNIQIGIGMTTERWRGADWWEARDDETLTLETLLERCEVVIPAVDGGGLDDLLALGVLGRERGTRRWLYWCRCWAHVSVLELRQSEASRLQDFVADGDLVLVDDMTEAFEELADLVDQVRDRGLLHQVGFDPMGVGLIIDALADRGIQNVEGEDPILVSVSQGWKLSGAIKTAEVKLSSGALWHAKQPIAAWAVGNAKAEAKGNATTITKQLAGAGKIDPVVALFTGVALMSLNPNITAAPAVHVL